MKDNLLEMLLNLFEKTLTQLKEQQVPVNASETLEQATDLESDFDSFDKDNRYELIAQPDSRSLRVITEEERLKLTKTSYQFLMRMKSLRVLSDETLERVIHRMVFSDSRFVSLQETKWIIRHTLANDLNSEALAFLDLVLYQSEDKMPLH